MFGHGLYLVFSDMYLEVIIQCLELKIIQEKVDNLFDFSYN